MASSAAKAIAIFGGTFDPVHVAHLQVARCALDALDAASVLWMPTGSPAYRQAPVASPEHRLAMLKLAIAGEPRYRIDERELHPAHSGYTVDTLESMRKESGDRLVLVMGADQYQKLDSWHRPQEVRKLADIAVVARPGASAAGASLIPMELMDVSASDIRGRIARGEDISGLLPPAVANYIRINALYR